jgi:hypothetical protein
MMNPGIGCVQELVPVSPSSVMADRSSPSPTNGASAELPGYLPHAHGSHPEPVTSRAT